MTRYRQRLHKLDGNSKQHFHAGYNQQHIAENDVTRRDSAEIIANDGDYLFSGDQMYTFNDVFGIRNFLLRQLIHSRIFLLLFQCAINGAMRDSATDAFKGIDAENEEQQNWLIHFIFGGLGRWDARHFLHIAEHGYVWESNLAFFPLFPVMLRILGSILHRLVGQTVSLFSAMLISGVLLNNVIFVLNGMLLFRLALLLNGGNLKEAILAVYIHCWCPASIFYSALYTESLYCLLTQFALLHLYSSVQSRQNLLVTSAIFSLAFLTRSNGLTNAGFVGFQLLLDAILVRQKDMTQSGEFQQQQLEFREFCVDLLAKNFLFFLLCFTIMSLPLRVFEFAVRDKFCTMAGGRYLDPRVARFLRNETAGREIVLPGELGKLGWCEESFSLSNLLLPSFYPQIQQKYWDVGPMAYWQWRKLPLFLMAAPTLWLALYGFYKQTFSLLSIDLRQIPEILVDKSSQIPFACHILFMALSGLFFYNVEVSIRLLFSASPFLYLVLARLINTQTPEQQRPQEDLMHSPVIPFLRVYMRTGFWPFLVFCYLFGFFIFGTMLHVNWLPFV